MEGESLSEGGGTVGRWMSKHCSMYEAATRHPFILSIKQGTVDLPSFKRWLEQDYIFIREFIPFVASVLLKACKESDDVSDMEVILGGLASLHDELAWFKKEATKWNVQLSDVQVLKANQDYCRFLERLMRPEIPYTVSMTAFWAIEAVYQESFSLCLEDGSKTTSELLETCQRWGNDGFKQYCLSLQTIANRILEKAHEDALNNAEAAFICVLEKEVGFWSMSSCDASV